MDENTYMYDGDLEKDIIGTFFIDTSNECIAKSILRPEHFLDETNRKMFNLLKLYYAKNKNVDIFEILKDYDTRKDVQKTINSYYHYAVTYVIGTSFFKKNEQRLIERWQKETSAKLFESYKAGKIEYKTLKIKLDEINQNQFFKNILDISSDIEDTTPSNNKKREYTGFSQLDYLTKGIEYGTLNVWSAVTNGGKTTLMTQFTKNFIRKGKKVFYFNGEQTAKEFKNNLYVSMCNKDQVMYVEDENNRKIIDIMPKDEVTRYYNSLFVDRLYVYNNEIPKNDIETMISVMDEALRKGVRIFFVDNFMQLDNSEQLDQQTRIVEKFKRFARDNDVIVILVAHPRKLNFGVTRLNVFDISGTQNISNKATNICTIMRTDTMSESEKDILSKYLYENGYLLDNCDSVVEVLKTKGNKNGVVGLVYDRDFKTFREVRRLTDEEKGRMGISFEGRKKRVN